MSSPVLHIKDSYFFEVPKALWRSSRTSREDFPDWWVRLDPDYQNWEAERLLEGLRKSPLIDENVIPDQEHLLEEFHHWQHESGNHGRPFDVFLETAPAAKWFQERVDTDKAQEDWAKVKQQAENVAEYENEAPAWSGDKLEQYNHELDGKILIPQPFAKLRNLHEKESGFAISKFMIIELLVAAIICFLFIRLAGRMNKSHRPRGRLWNLFESILLYFRDHVARPAIGGKEADRFVPLLWTLFLFILGCNLFGMLPWMGAPTGALAVTFGLALVTFTTVLVSGIKQFGFMGFWKNQVPHLGLPAALAVLIVPMIFLIEVVGLFIKHGVLSVRLLANMVAGHLVLLALMGLAVTAAGSELWGLTATISVIGATLISCLELFVAFLQAFIFTFLSALFIGMAIHHH